MEKISITAGWIFFGLGGRSIFYWAFDKVELQRGKGDGNWRRVLEPEHSQIICQRNKSGLGNWAVGL